MYSSLVIGSKLAHYEILEPLGAGGMGEVYRARDTNLKRDVAIKVLPQTLTEDPVRLARLEREAHILASLNHPNIATIFSLDEADGARFLVLELIDGETLAERLATGPMRLEAALETCGQVALALEVAHEAGVVHRDLKPGNVMFTADGRVKVLDFGIAKSIESAAGDGAQQTELTMDAGFIGSPAYMSPEQIRRNPLDKRSDVWGFGCLLYETLVGESPFFRETAGDALAAVLEQEPDWSRLPTTTPVFARLLLQRCLQKDPKRRQRDIGDAWVEIDQAKSSDSGVWAPVASSASDASVGVPRGLMRALGVLVVLALGVAAGWYLAPAPQLGSDGPLRFDFDLPEGAVLPAGRGNTVAVSAAGDLVAFSATGPDGSLLYLRRLDALESAPLPGTEEATRPFFSPDGQWLGFRVGQSTEAEYRAVSIAGGDTVSLCSSCTTATWADDGSILAVTLEHGWSRISEIGVEPEPLEPVVVDGAQVRLQRPAVLPGSRAVLFESGSIIYAVELETNEITEVVDNASSPLYALGHVLFPRGNTMYALPFDADSLRVLGEPVPIVRGVTVEEAGQLQAAVSENGVLVFAPISPAGMLVRVDRNGGWEPLLAQRGDYRAPRVAPDGSRVALEARPGRTDEVWGAGAEIWVVDAAVETFNRLPTIQGVGVQHPVWSRDGTRIAYTARLAGASFSIVVQPADGTGNPETIITAQGGANLPFPQAWTPADDRLLIVRGYEAIELAELATGAAATTNVFVEDGASVVSASLSHDGEWVAYVSDTLGTREVYVRPVTGPGGAVRVSQSGGREPVWGPGDRELFYIAGGELISAKLDTADGFRVSSRDELFDATPYPSVQPNFTDYDVYPDGQHFVMIRSGAAFQRPKINVVINWPAELR